MYQEACEATQVRGEQSAEVLDLRMSCLQERLGGMRALTDLFTEASGDVVENAVSAVNALGSLDRCADVSGPDNSSCSSET
jgi:serine/threonine-protein kinase